MEQMLETVKTIVTETKLILSQMEGFGVISESNYHHLMLTTLNLFWEIRDPLETKIYILSNSASLGEMLDNLGSNK